jgi:MFS family permease
MRKIANGVRKEVNAREPAPREIPVVRVYVALLRNRRYRLVWAGATVSILGDGAAWVALSWTAYSVSESAADVGGLLVAYTAPVVVGGPLVGVLLDRFDRRRLLIADNLVRAAAMLAIPLLYAAGSLRLWHLYAAAGVYGLLKMFPLAGIPSLIPDLVAEDELDAANAMESFSFMLGSVLGPALGGVLLAFVDGPYVLALDALTYVAFALALAAAGPIAPAGPEARGSEPQSLGLRPAFALVLRTPVVLATTVMFMLVNVGEGIVAVLLPVYVDEVGAGATAYGALLALGAAAGLVGAALAGATGGRIRYGRAIAGSEALAGVSVAPLVVEPPLAVAFVAVAASWFFLGPLTVWAQTLRMRVIPPELRGRVFGLLRTAMQGTLPLGGALAPLLVAAGGLRAGFVAAALVVAVPGVVGLFLPALGGRELDRLAACDHEAVALE